MALFGSLRSGSDNRLLAAAAVNGRVGGRRYRADACHPLI